MFTDRFLKLQERKENIWKLNFKDFEDLKFEISKYREEIEELEELDADEKLDEYDQEELAKHVKELEYFTNGY